MKTDIECVTDRIPKIPVEKGERLVAIMDDPGYDDNTPVVHDCYKEDLSCNLRARNGELYPGVATYPFSREFVTVLNDAIQIAEEAGCEQAVLVVESWGKKVGFYAI